MADDHYSRPPRQNNPYARPQPAHQGHSSGGDPLAELARLIGQTPDPYSGHTQASPQGSPFGASNGAANGAAYAHDQRHAPDQHYTPGNGADWRDNPDAYAQQDPYAQQGGYQDDYGAGAPPYNPPAAYQDPAYAAPHAPAQGYDDPNYSDQSYREPQYGEQNYAGDAAYQDQAYTPQSYAPPSYADPQYSERPQADARYVDPQQATPQFASPQYDDKPYPAYDNQLYAKQGPAFAAATHGGVYGGQQQPAPNGQGYPGTHYDDPQSQGYGAPYYHQDAAPESDEDHAPARRRGGLVTVLAVLALAVIGTAAAFGYRAVFTTSGTRVPPPVIKADTAPSKIVPAANDSTKPIQDRVGDRAQTERIVNREEQPIDVNTARAGAPRVVFPGPNPIAPLPNSPLPQSANALVSAPTGSAGASSTEPKKIRTVTIRSDQPDPASTARAAAAIPSPVSRSNVPSGVLPEDDQSARNTARAQAPAAASSGPLSLSPGQTTQRSAPMRTAATPPAAAVNGSGGYSVQVTSQRSEGEAQSAYAALQSKFGSVLGNRQAVIRRADLGDKGVYYRAQVPFSSQNEAADFCVSLRNAGGQCVVQRN